MQQKTDGELVLLVRSGNKQAFSELLQRYQPRLISRLVVVLDYRKRAKPSNISLYRSRDPSNKVDQCQHIPNQESFFHIHRTCLTLAVNPHSCIT